MIKIYGMPTCPYCDYIQEQIAGRKDKFEYINIGEHIRYLSAFMRLRDNLRIVTKQPLYHFNGFEPIRSSCFDKSMGLSFLSCSSICILATYRVLFRRMPFASDSILLLRFFSFSATVNHVKKHMSK